MSETLDPRLFTDPYLQIYGRVPPPGPGVCRVCHSGPNTGYDVCLSCTRALGQVSHPLSVIVPISLYEIPSQLHHWLRQYKDGPTAEVREKLGTHVAATLARFIHGHLDCIAGAVGHEPTLATTVPSSGRRQGRHPLEIAVERLLRLRPIYRPALGWTGAVQLDHNLASDHAYEPTFDVEAHHVLLIDDTLTSAARVISAASTLLSAGAATVAVVVIGRVIKPAWNENCARIWEAARATEFDFDVCCLET